MGCLTLGIEKLASRLSVSDLRVLTRAVLATLLVAMLLARARSLHQFKVAERRLAASQSGAGCHAMAS